MHDKRQDGNSIRFNMIDDFSQEALGIAADISLPPEL